MSSDLILYRRLWLQARPYWRHISALLCLALLSTPLTLLSPIPLQIAIDHVLGDRPITGMLAVVLPASARSAGGLLIFATVLLVLVASLTQVQDLGRWWLRTYTGERLVLDFRATLFRHVQRLSLSYHDTKGMSDSAYRIQHDAPAIQYIVIDGVIPLVSAVVTLLGMIAVMARLDRSLAVVALAISPALFLLTRVYSRRLRRHWRQMKDQESSALSVVQEVLSAVRVVKAFGKEAHEQERFVRHSQDGIQTRLRLALFQGGFDVLVGLTTAVGTAVVLWLGVSHVRAGLLTLGQLLIVMTYLAQLYAPLRTISSKTTDIQSSITSAERAFALLDEVPDVMERPHAKSLVRAKGAVVFQSVSFGYDPRHPVLHDISFAVQPGARVGIAGTTGSGKTTLASLLTRFYDPLNGVILLDGVDLRDYKLADLRKQFAIVFQEPVLFSTTIAENIAYGRPGASQRDIVEAAKAANANEFIALLPKGYDTQVGERGMRLSGGERQRISLARAFLKDAPMLILDEPTSAVDVKTEAAIMEAMERLMHGRTTFMIAHRLSTLQHCDVRLEIAAGRLIPPTLAEVPPPEAASALVHGA